MNYTKVIARNNNIFMVTSEDTTLNDDLKDAILMDIEGRTISSPATIAALLKAGDFEPYDENISNIITKDDSIKSALIGAAVGDAFGVPYEFLSREDINKIGINDNMIGNNSEIVINSRWGKIIPKGSWSDDTSMIVATMESMISLEKIDYTDIMNNYVNWWTKAQYTSLDKPFGLGGTVAKALTQFTHNIDPIMCGPTDFMDNGNGSLMRILPFSLLCASNDLSSQETYHIIHDASSLTHGNEISIFACYAYTVFLKEAIISRNIDLAYNKMINEEYDAFFSSETIDLYKDVLTNNFKLTPNDIKESGYVVDTFKAVIFSLLNSYNYSGAIKTAVSLGYDTDTVGCITGSLAGIIYGINNIPDNWKKDLKKENYLESLAYRFKNSNIVLQNLKIK